MKYKDMLNKSDQELQQQSAELRRELIKERAQIAIGSQLKSPRKAYQLRKNIARLLMITNQRKQQKQQGGSSTSTVGKAAAK